MQRSVLKYAVLNVYCDTGIVYNPGIYICVCVCTYRVTKF